MISGQDAAAPTDSNKKKMQLTLICYPGAIFGTWHDDMLTFYSPNPKIYNKNVLESPHNSRFLEFFVWLSYKGFEEMLKNQIRVKVNQRWKKDSFKTMRVGQ